MTTSNTTKRRTIIFAGIALILLIPLIAMQFTDEVVWTLSDFIVAGILLSVTGIAAELILYKTKSRKLKYALIALLLLGIFLVWAELAVGIFGSPFAGS